MTKQKLKMLMHALSNTSEIILKVEVEGTGGFEAEVDEEAFEWIQEKLKAAYKVDSEKEALSMKEENFYERVWILATKVITWAARKCT